MLRRSSRLTLLIGFGVAWAPTLGGAMWPVLPVSPAREALLHLARSDVDQRPPAQPVPSSLPLTRVLFDSETVATYGSRCLDGSASGYYVRWRSNQTRWAIFLEGGGLCVTPQDCKKRATTDLGSSKKWSATWSDDNNVLSRKPANPFHDWNHVYVPYCSGDVYIGQQRKKNLFGLFFAGHLTMEALVDHLANTTTLTHATSVLLSGGSAGGIGTFQNADWLSSRFAPGVVKASPQAGWYFASPKLVLYPEFSLDTAVPFAPLASSYLYDWFGGLGSEPPYLDQSCIQANLKSPHQCWDAPVHYPHITTPLFIAENEYDSNQIGDIMGLNWWPLKDATTAMGYKRYFGKMMRSGTTEVGRNAGKADGLFMPSCYRHTGNLCMVGGSIVANVTFAQALSDWYFNGARKLGRLFVDNCTADGPCNTHCSC